MEFTELTLRLLFVFLPGILATLVYFRLTTQPIKTPFFFLIYSFIFGMLSYIVVALIYFFYYQRIYLYPFLYDFHHPIDEVAVMIALIISIPIAFGLSKLSNSKILFRFACKVKCSNQTGYHSIWEEFFESTQEDQFITIRDLKNDMIFHGALKSFSQAGEDREVIITDVMIYENKSGKELNIIPYSKAFLSIPLGNNYFIEITNENKNGDVNNVRE